jgi:hypothetical protein
MVRIHRGWLVAAVALSFSVAACKKSEKKSETPTPTDKTAEKGSTTTEPGAGKAVPTPGATANGANDDLSLLPVDSEIVMGLNFTQLQQSSLWKKFVEPKLMDGEVQKKFAEFKDKCGFDPLASVKSISLGLLGIGAKKPDGAVVIHGPDKGKVMACLDKMKDEAQKDGDKIETDAGITTVTTKDGDKFAMTFVNDTTMLGVIGANANAAGVKAAAGGGSTLRTSPAFVDMYSKINTGDSLWMLMNGNSHVFDKAAGMGFKPKAVFGSVNVTDGLTLDLRMRLDSPDQAAQIAGMAKGQAAQAKAMFDKLDIGNEGADVKVSLGLSSAKLDALIQQFAGLVGNMGGM